MTLVQATRPNKRQRDHKRHEGEGGDAREEGEGVLSFHQAASDGAVAQAGGAANWFARRAGAVLAALNLFDRRERHAELPRQDIGRVVGGTNSLDVLAMKLPTSGAFHSPLLACVAYVFLLRSPPEMARVDADRIVAAVARLLRLVGPLASIESKRNVRSRSIPRLRCEVAVPVAVEKGRPRPTLVSPGYFHFSPKALARFIGEHPLIENYHSGTVAESRFVLKQNHQLGSRFVGSVP